MGTCGMVRFVRALDPSSGSPDCRHWPIVWVVCLAVERIRVAKAGINDWLVFGHAPPPPFTHPLYCWFMVRT
ncbi:hypothetical protein BaRGS_00003303 [Batillaria attramentaria]|uniref:Uncharacterized protein n=1 Tax=Batillaria attramentaria TaxID=370345 RepID=A0ABD0M2E6_9CAEN